MEKIRLKKIYIGLIGVVALWGTAGCGDKSDPNVKTTQQVNDFKGHQPTPAQLQAAIAKSSQPAPAPGPPSAAK